MSNTMNSTGEVRSHDTHGPTKPSHPLFKDVRTKGTVGDEKNPLLLTLPSSTKGTAGSEIGQGKTLPFAPATGASKQHPIQDSQGGGDTAAGSSLKDKIQAQLAGTNKSGDSGLASNANITTTTTTTMSPSISGANITTKKNGGDAAIGGIPQINELTTTTNKNGPSHNTITTQKNNSFHVDGSFSPIIANKTTNDPNSLPTALPFHHNKGNNNNNNNKMNHYGKEHKVHPIDCTTIRANNFGPCVLSDDFYGPLLWLVLFALICCCCCCCCCRGRSGGGGRRRRRGKDRADALGEYRAVAAFTDGAFDADMYDEEIFLSDDDDVVEDAAFAAGDYNDNRNGHNDDHGWSDRRSLEMKTIGKELNGGLTLEEVNG